jgi:hypothetical protein
LFVLAVRARDLYLPLFAAFTFLSSPTQDPPSPPVASPSGDAISDKLKKQGSWMSRIGFKKRANELLPSPPDSTIAGADDVGLGSAPMVEDAISKEGGGVAAETPTRLSRARSRHESEMSNDTCVLWDDDEESSGGMKDPRHAIWTQHMEDKSMPLHLEQRGVLRTNCIDCLDRTNVAQFCVGMKVLGSQLHAMGIHNVSEVDTQSDCVRLLREMYAHIGDRLALQYAGSEAHKKVDKGSGASQKVGGNAKHKELINSAIRYYSGTFTDKEKQSALNLFLGHFQPVPKGVSPASLGGDRKTYMGVHLWELDGSMTVLPPDFYLHNVNVMQGLDRVVKEMKAWKELSKTLRPLRDRGASAASQQEAALPATMNHVDDVGAVQVVEQGETKDYESHLRKKRKRIVQFKHRRRRQRKLQRRLSITMWWNQPLLDYEQKRMWMSNGLTDTAQYLPDRFEQEHHPRKLTKFDDVLCHPFTKPSKGRADMFDQNHTSGHDPSHPDFESSSTQHNLVNDSVEYTIGSLSPMNSIGKQSQPSKQQGSFVGGGAASPGDGLETTEGGAAVASILDDVSASHNPMGDSKPNHRHAKSSSQNNPNLKHPRRTSMMSIVDIVEEMKSAEKDEPFVLGKRPSGNAHHKRSNSNMSNMQTPKDGSIIHRHNHLNHLFIGCLRSTEASENMEKYFSVYFTFMRDPRLHMTMINVHQKKWFRSHLSEFSLSENDPKGNREAQSKASAVTVLRTGPYRYMKQTQSATDPKILLNTIREVDSEKSYYKKQASLSTLCDLQSSLSTHQSISMYESFFDSTSIDCDSGTVSSMYEQYVNGPELMLGSGKKVDMDAASTRPLFKSGLRNSQNFRSSAPAATDWSSPAKRTSSIRSVTNKPPSNTQVGARAGYVGFPLKSALVKSGQYILLNEPAKENLGKVV